MVMDAKMTLSGALAPSRAEMQQLLLDNTPVSPKEAADRFKWGEKLIQPDDYLPKFNAFFDSHPELAGVDREALFATINDSFRLIEELTATMISAERGETMNYHNEIHSQITAIQALKHTLGSIALAQRNGTLPEELQNPDNLNKFLRTVVVSAACHEVNDWNVKPLVDPITRQPTAEAKAEKLTRVERARVRINEFLETHNISRRDFNMLIDADNFAKPTETVVAEVSLIEEFITLNGLSQDTAIDMVDSDDFDPSQYRLGEEMQALKMTYKDKDGNKAKDRKMPRSFLKVEDDPVTSLMGQIMDRDKAGFDQALPLYAYSIGAADFGQVGNPEYLRTIKVQVGEEVYSVPAGPLALAYEMHKYTDNWAVTSGFGTVDETGELQFIWENVTSGAYFWNNYALPRIQGGIASMKEFSPGEGGEGQNAENLYGNLHHIIQENDERLKVARQAKKESVNA